MAIVPTISILLAEFNMAILLLLLLQFADQVFIDSTLLGRFVCGHLQSFVKKKKNLKLCYIASFNIIGIWKQTEEWDIGVGGGGGIQYSNTTSKIDKIPTSHHLWLVMLT